MQHLPLVSVILVTKDRAQYVERFLLSLFREIDDYQLNVELLVVDGASTDGTVDILKKYDDRIDWWVSEPDSGVSDAANKGFQRATGTYWRLAGDDDELYPGKFLEMIEWMEQNEDVDWLLCHADWFNEDESGNQTLLDTKQPEEGYLSWKDMITFNQTIGVITIESALFRPRKLNEAGLYSDDFYLWAYWEFWLRQFKAGARFYVWQNRVMKRINTPLGATALHAKDPRWSEELYRVVRLHGGWYWLVWHKRNRLSFNRFLQYTFACVKNRKIL
jgi:glycosyltransferase involved in cell wall biosynthesis